MTFFKFDILLGKVEGVCTPSSFSWRSSHFFSFQSLRAFNFFTPSKPRSERLAIQFPEDERRNVVKLHQQGALFVPAFDFVQLRQLSTNPPPLVEIYLVLSAHADTSLSSSLLLIHVRPNNQNRSPNKKEI